MYFHLQAKPIARLASDIFLDCIIFFLGLLAMHAILPPR